MKALNHKLARSSDGNFGTDYTYLCDSNRSIETCFEENFFSPLIDHLMPADTIRIVEMKEGRVAALQVGIVISKSKTKPELDFRPFDDQGIHRYPFKGLAELAETPEGPAPIFIPGEGTIEQDLVSKVFKVSWDGGSCEVESLTLAKAIVRGDKPIPQ